MVFRMIHVKDALLPMGKVWSLDFLGILSNACFHVKSIHDKELSSWIQKEGPCFCVLSCSHDRSMVFSQVCQLIYQKIWCIYHPCLQDRIHGFANWFLPNKKSTIQQWSVDIPFTRPMVPKLFSKIFQVRSVVTRCCAEPVSRILKDYPEMPVGGSKTLGGKGVEKTWVLEYDYRWNPWCVSGVDLDIWVIYIWLYISWAQRQPKMPDRCFGYEGSPVLVGWIIRIGRGLCALLISGDVKHDFMISCVWHWQIQRT